MNCERSISFRRVAVTKAASAVIASISPGLRSREPWRFRSGWRTSQLPHTCSADQPRPTAGTLLRRIGNAVPHQGVGESPPIEVTPTSVSSRASTSSLRWSRGSASPSPEASDSSRKSDLAQRLLTCQHCGSSGSTTSRRFRREMESAPEERGRAPPASIGRCSGRTCVEPEKQPSRGVQAPASPPYPPRQAPASPVLTCFRLSPRGLRYLPFGPSESWSICSISMQLT